MSADSVDETTALNADATKLKQPGLLQDPQGWLQNCSSRWQLLLKSFSWQLLVMVACTNHLLKGFVAGGGDGGLIGAPMEFIFKDHGVAGGKMQVYMAMATSPWALKPLIGLLSDSCPLFGYRKMPYIFITAVLGLGGVATLGFMNARLSLGAVVLCLFFAFLMVATADLLVEATQSQEVKDSAQLGPDFFLFTWLGIVIGMILATLLVGPIIEHWSAHTCYLVALPFILPLFWPLLKNYMGERRLPEGETMLSRLTANFQNHPVMFWLCLGVGLLIAGMSVLTFSAKKDSEDTQALAISVASALLLAAIGVFIRSEIAGPVVFWFLLQACPQVNGALFYFYTDGPKAFPGGPHFSAWMYATGMGLAGLLGVLAGYLSGSALFANWRYTSILLLTVPSRAVVRLCLLPVLWRWSTTRYNISGVPDPYSDVYWVFPVEFFSSMLFAWSWVPKQVMNAQLTPKGNEATMLALTAGTFNMGSMVSSYLGCWLLSTFKICADGTPGDRADLMTLWRPYIICVLAPVLVLILLPLFIPHKLQTEVLITEHPESPTYGSFKQRMTAQSAEPQASPPI